MGSGGFRRAVLLLVPLILLSAAPASARWWGSMQRLTNKAGDGRIVAEFVSDRPAIGLHVGLNGSYTITNVESDVAGPFGANGCTPTSRSDVTTHNAGVDCTFGVNTQHAIIWFTASPRIPDGEGGKAYDDDTQETTSVRGPLSAADAERIRPFLKRLALQSADANRFSRICEGAASLKVYADISDCYDEYNEQYDQLIAAHDPPDSAGDEVWVPVGHKSPPPPGCPASGAAKARRACGATRKLVLAMDQAQARYAAIWDALATTVNRLSGAQQAEESLHIAIQNAALLADSAEVLTAGVTLAAARRKLASKLTSLGVSPQLSAKAVATADRRQRAGALPDYAVSGFNANGITADMLKTAFGALPAVQRKPLKLVAVLRAPTFATGPAGAVAAKVRKATFDDLRVLALGLLSNKTISEDLYGKLANAAIAQDARAYSAAAAQAGGEAANLLQAALGAVAGR